MAEKSAGFRTPGRVFGRKSNFGVVIGDRGFFPKHLVESGRKRTLEILDELGVDAVVPSTEDTKLGAVGTLDDARKCGDLFRWHRNEIDGVLVVLPNFGDEKSVVNALRFSGLDVPVLVVAVSDEAGRMTAEHRSDTFCGKISVCNNLRQYRIPFTLTSKHTLSLEGDEIKDEIRRFQAVCRVVKGVRGARLGAVGARPADFNTVRFSEKILEGQGIAVETVDLSEILGRANRLTDEDKPVKEKVEAIGDYADLTDVPKLSVSRMARLAVSLDEWIQANLIDALAIQCWTSIEENYGIVPCALMSMLSESLIPAACEVDIPGALAMYALSLASEEPSALLDWNNNYGEDPAKCVLFHCSNLPAAFFGGRIRMCYQAIIAGSVGEENAYGSCEGRIPAGPFTFLRVDTDDELGMVRAYTGTGEFTDDPLDTFGGYGVGRIAGLQSLLRYICLSGFAHHVAASRAECAGIVEEAFDTYLGWDVYHHFGE